MPGMKEGDQPFWCPVSEPDAVDRAKEFCRSRKLTPDDVKIVKRDGHVRVVVKRDGAVCK